MVNKDVCIKVVVRAQVTVKCAENSIRLAMNRNVLRSVE